MTSQNELNDNVKNAVRAMEYSVRTLKDRQVAELMLHKALNELSFNEKNQYLEAVEYLSKEFAALVFVTKK